MSQLKRFGVVGLSLVLLGAGCAGTGSDGTAGGGGGKLAGGTGVITVDTPSAGDTISSPFTVTGTATTSDGEVYLRLRDQDGTLMVSSHTNVDSSGLSEENAYRFTSVYFFADATSGVLEMYWDDGTGTESDHLEIPVTIE